MKRLAVSFGVAVLFAASAVAPAFAAHTHNLSVPGVAEPVLAPGFCEPAADTGFQNFHSNVHQGVDFGGEVEIDGTNGCVS